MDKISKEGYKVVKIWGQTVDWFSLSDLPFQWKTLTVQQYSLVMELANKYSLTKRL